MVIFSFQLSLIFSATGKSIISILPEIDCSKFSKDDLSNLLDDTQNLMQKHYTELTNEVKHKK